MAELTLYGRRTCPYCLRVISHIQNRGVDIPLCDTSDPDNRSRLIEIGGKGQVPCLVIDGAPMYESGDIISWIDANL